MSARKGISSRLQPNDIFQFTDDLKRRYLVTGSRKEPVEGSLTGRVVIDYVLEGEPQNGTLTLSEECEVYYVDSIQTGRYSPVFFYVGTRKTVPFIPRQHYM